MPIPPGMRLPTLLLLVLPLGLAGCITMPAPQGQTSKAHYIGDRAMLELDEMVFTVNVQDTLPATAPYQNLHVRFTAVINPKATTTAGSLYEVDDIVGRLQPRIRARVVEIVPIGHPVAVQSLESLKTTITQEARNTFRNSFAKWKHADDFDVQLVVASYYLTDLSVGPAPQTRRSWW
jgi:hypothetical protein